jgi:nucleoside-diphosphate-sugar epimerase
MRIAITGAAGNLGQAVGPRLVEAGHDVLLSDRVPPSESSAGPRFFAADVVTGEGLDKALADRDLLVHLPAWHGIHVADHSDDEFWSLNVEGTRNTLEAAARAGVSRVVFLSSQSWHERLATYGFTKVIGELLLEYHREHHGLAYVALRPGDFTPWGDDWPRRYGARLLYGGVDRDDVTDAVLASVAYLEHADAGLALDVVHPNTVHASELDDWEGDPLRAVERAFPGSSEVVTRYGLDIARRPAITGTAGQAEVGWTAVRHFGTFADEARALGPERVAAMRCPY